MMIFIWFVFGIFLTLNGQPARADYPKSDELTLRNQLLADVYFLKEGVDKLLITSEVLNKRFTNQMDVLKTLQNKLTTNNNFDTDVEVETNCDKITGMFNATLKKQNILENRLIIKLEEIQEEQLVSFEEMLVKLRLNKNCGTQAVTSSTLTLLSTSLSDVSEKIEQFEEKLMKFATLETKLNEQQMKFAEYATNQMEILQQINDKLAKNQQQFDEIKQDLTNFIDLNTDLKNAIKRPTPKLPMEVILGLTSANITSFK